MFQSHRLGRRAVAALLLTPFISGAFAAHAADGIDQPAKILRPNPEFTAATRPEQTLTFIQVESEVVYCGPSSLYCDASVQCPAGLVAWGGGLSAFRSKLVGSWPTDSRTWSATFQPARLEFGDDVTGVANAFVNCAPAPAGYEIVAGDMSECVIDGPSCSTTVECPSGKTALSGGVDGIESHFESVRPINATTWSISWFPDDESLGPSSLGRARPYVVCADAPPEGFEIRNSAPEQCAPGESCYASAHCSTGLASFAGGIWGGESKIEGMRTDRSAAGGSWYPATTEFGPSAAGSAMALTVCAAGVTILDDLFLDGFEP